VGGEEVSGARTGAVGATSWLGAGFGSDGRFTAATSGSEVGLTDGGCLPLFAEIAGADFGAGIGAIASDPFFELSAFAGGGPAGLGPGMGAGCWAAPVKVRARRLVSVAESGGGTVRVSAGCFPLQASTWTDSASTT